MLQTPTMPVPEQPAPFAGVTLTLTTDGSAVRMTGPWWGWDANGGPEAVEQWRRHLDSYA